jgi:hypothetical protein
LEGISIDGFYRFVAGEGFFADGASLFGEFCEAGTAVLADKILGGCPFNLLSKQTE